MFIKFITLVYWSASYKKLIIILGTFYIYLIIIYSKSSVCFSFTHENVVILLYYICNHVERLLGIDSVYCVK